MTELAMCGACQGNGEVLVRYQSGQQTASIECPACAGSGDERHVVYSLWWVVHKDGRKMMERYGQWHDEETALAAVAQAEEMFPDAEFEKRIGWSAPPYTDPRTES